MKPTLFQEKIIKYNKKKYLSIIAGPGAGKTFCLIERVKFLINELDVSPDRILLITFTNKATNEMKSRLIRELDKDVVKLLNISTIHSFCYKLLRDDSETRLEYENYELLDENSQYMFIFRIWDSLTLEFSYKFHDFGGFVKEVGDVFSKLKDFNITPENFKNYINSRTAELDNQGPKEFSEEEISRIFKEKRLCESYRKYNESLIYRRGNTEFEKDMDYGDILQKFLEKLQENKEFLNKIQNMFDYILIDEYQDTNKIQGEIIEKIANKSTHITIVADENQSIYKFRGAYSQNIPDFINKFGAEEKLLKENFRSTQTFIDFSNALISNNSNWKVEQKITYPKDKPKDARIENKIFLLNAETQEEEADVIAKLIELLVSKQRLTDNSKGKNENKLINYSDIGILFRSVRNHSAEYLNILDQYDIPYHVRGNGGFFYISYIRDIILIMYYINRNKLVIDFQNLNIFSLTDHTRELFENKADELEDFFCSYHRDLKKKHTVAEKEQFIRDYFSDTNIEHMIQNFGITEQNDVLFFTKLLKLKRDYLLKKKKASTLVTFYNILRITEFFSNILKSKDNVKLENLAKISKLIFQAQEILRSKNISQFLWYVNLLPENSIDTILEEAHNLDRVQVCTIHQAKGLEFPIVFIPNLVSRRFPPEVPNSDLRIPEFFLKEDESDSIEEERRIFYVGMTRTMDQLFLSNSKKIRRKNREESLFIKNLDSSLYERIEDFSKENLENLVDSIEIKSERKVEDLVQMQQISFTKLLYYKICPLWFRLRFEFEFRTSIRPFISYGRSIHHALGVINARIDKGETLNNRSIREIVNETWIDKGYGTVVKSNLYKRNALKDILDYYRINKDLLEQCTRFSPEERFEYFPENYLFKISGIIDLVRERYDISKGKNIIELVDFKAGTFKNPNGSLKRKKIEEGMEQLTFYAFCYKKIHNVEVDKVILYSVRDNQGHEIRITSTIRIKVKNNINNLLGKIERKDFDATPSKDGCKRCDFNNHCCFSHSFKSDYIEAELPEYEEEMDNADMDEDFDLNSDIEFENILSKEEV